MRKKREDKYATITEVAKEAGVSIATVSRVLNNGKVREVRRRRVMDAIEKLEYVPNNSARNLASVNTTKRITLLIPDLTTFYLPIIKGFKYTLSVYKFEGVIETYIVDDTVSKSIYESALRRMESSGEVKGIVQFGPKKDDLHNKITYNYLDSIIKFDIDKSFENKNIGLYFSKDKIEERFVSKVMFKNIVTKKVKLENLKEHDIIITSDVESAFELVNAGFKKTIKVLEKVEHTTKAHKNIQSLEIDLYGVGTLIARHMIKEIKDEDNKYKIPLSVK